MSPIHLFTVEVLDEVDHGKRYVEPVPRYNDPVPTPLAWSFNGAKSKPGDDKNCKGAKPDQPVRLDLIASSLELLVSSVPPEIE